MWAINTTVQDTTKVSPAFLKYGRQPGSPINSRREMENVPTVAQGNVDIWKDRIKRLDALRDLVKRHVDKARQKQKHYYDMQRRDQRFRLGDKVLRRVHVLFKASENFAAKLAPVSEGSLEITRVISPVMYEILGGVGRRVPRLYISELKAYRE